MVSFRILIKKSIVQGYICLSANLQTHLLFFSEPTVWLYFPVFITSRFGHVIEFHSVKCECMWCVPLLDLAHKISQCVVLHIFISSSWLERMSPWDELGELVETQNEKNSSPWTPAWKPAQIGTSFGITEWEIYYAKPQRFGGALCAVSDIIPF